MRDTLLSATLAASMLMASAGYLVRGINAEPARANVIAMGQPCNWRTCGRKPKRITTADKSGLAMLASRVTGERMR